MTIAVVLFEDHSAHQFRPLSWTVPVHEMGCGLFNLRERLGMICAEAGHQAGLLPRGVLQDLQDVSVPDGWAAGPDAVLATAAAADRVLLINGRSSLRWSGLRALLAAEGDTVLRDEDGLVAWSGPSADAVALLDDWRRWDRRCTESGAWFTCDIDLEPWTPDLAEAAGSGEAWRYLWERVHDIAPAIADDVQAVAADGSVYRRWIFGVAPLTGQRPAWSQEQSCRPLDLAKYPAVSVIGGRNIWVGPDVVIDPGVVLDVRKGSIVLEAGTHVQPHATLCGPLTVGAESTVKSGAVIYGETSIGPVCKMCGEIAESQVAAYANKQHAGFLGHAVIGSWVNLGADTTCSDLKNNYGEIRVNFGAGPVDTGSRFLGLMVAEHAKSAIGTTFNTATTVGVSANVFSSGFPRTYIPNFAWGDGRGRRFLAERALETARIVMGRRGIGCSEAHAAILTALYEGGRRPAVEHPAT